MADIERALRKVTMLHKVITSSPFTVIVVVTVIRISGIVIVILLLFSQKVTTGSPFNQNCFLLRVGCRFQKSRKNLFLGQMGGGSTPFQKSVYLPKSSLADHPGQPKHMNVLPFLF